jgi:hypothetical protein
MKKLDFLKQLTLENKLTLTDASDEISNEHISEIREKFSKLKR